MFHTPTPSVYRSALPWASNWLGIAIACMTIQKVQWLPTANAMYVHAHLDTFARYWADACMYSYILVLPQTQAACNTTSMYHHSIPSTCIPPIVLLRVGRFPLLVQTDSCFPSSSAELARISPSKRGPQWRRGRKIVLPARARATYIRRPVSAVLQKLLPSTTTTKVSSSSSSSIQVLSEHASPCSRCTTLYPSASHRTAGRSSRCAQLQPSKIASSSCHPFSALPNSCRRQLLILVMQRRPGQAAKARLDPVCPLCCLAANVNVSAFHQPLLSTTTPSVMIFF